MKEVDRMLKLLIRASATVLLMFAPFLKAQAQCAMCRAAVESASNVASLSRALNIGGLVLLIPPLFLFTGFFVLAWRYAKARDVAFNQTEQESVRKKGRRFSIFSVKWERSGEQLRERQTGPLA